MELLIGSERKRALRVLMKSTRKHIHFDRSMRIYDKSMSRHDLCIFLLVRLSYFYATSKKAIFSAPISTKTDKKQRDFISK